MHSNTLAYPLVLALFAGASSAQDLLTYEPFAYGVTGTTVGELNGKNGGFGWAGPWVGPRQLPLVAAWWPFEKDARDSSGQKIDGVLKGTLSSTSFAADVPTAIKGWSTKSLTFNGTSDYIDLTAHLAKFRFANMGTLSAWFKSSTSGPYTIFSISDSKSASVETSLGLSSGKIYFSTRAGGYLSSGITIRSANTYNDGKWHHVAWVVSRAQMTTIYVDGVSILTAPTFQALAGNLPRADTMAIGRNVDSGGGQWYYKGQLDDLAFYGVPLTAADVAKLALTVPIAVIPKNDTGGPELHAASMTSSAYASRGLLSHGNRSVHRGVVTRHLAKNIDLDKDGVYYASVLISRTDRTGGVISPMLLSFHTGAAHVGRFGWGTNGALRAGAGTIRTAAKVISPNTNYLVVLKWETSAASMDKISCKAYAPTGTVHASDASISGQGSGANQWDVEGLAFAGNGVVDRLLFDNVLDLSSVGLDEIRIGKTWDSVTRAVFGATCHGAAIGKVGLPQLNTTNFQVTLDKAPASASGFFIVGLSKDKWGAINLPLNLVFLGAGGCFMNVSLDLMLGAATNAAGNAAMPITIPNTPALVDQTIFVQWAIDGVGVPSKMVTTEGLQITVLR